MNRTWDMPWIIKSGEGYFIKFQNNITEMTTDLAEAYRMDYESARSVKKLMEQYGFEAELVNIGTENEP